MRKEFRGYDPLAVDAFLSRCLATPGIYRSSFAPLRGRTPAGARVTAQEVEQVRFPKATWGYQIRAVDALLDELQAAVAATTWTPEPEPVTEPRTIRLDQPQDEPAQVPLVLTGLRRLPGQDVSDPSRVDR